MGSVTVEPIRHSDTERVGDFLHRNLNPRLSAGDWAGAVLPPWPVESPNHGFMLLDGSEIVGAYLAFYSDRTINGKRERFCNLAAWCVLPKFRLHSLRLLKALLGQSGFHFTDLSPSGNTVPINERLKFTRLDTTTALMPNLPWPSIPGRCRIATEHHAIEKLLSVTELQVYRDHRFARAARQIVISMGADRCHVIFRRDRRKRLPLFASVLYVSNPAVFSRCVRVFGRHLLLRHGIPATLLDLRVVGERPPGSLLLRTPRPKMFKSDHLLPEQIDYLYSELVCVVW